MIDITNLRDTIIPKSDQLNSDDLSGTVKQIKITAVSRGNLQQPIIINYEGDDGRPYKPCKTMRKLIIFAWGQDGSKWIGKSLKLYCDTSVKFGGENVGGIRISHMSHIEKQINASFVATRGMKKAFTVDVLEEKPKSAYPDFDTNFESMQEKITSGKMTPEQVITHCENKGFLSEQQRSSIRAVKPTGE